MRSFISKLAIFESVTLGHFTEQHFGSDCTVSMPGPLCMLTQGRMTSHFRCNVAMPGSSNCLWDSYWISAALRHWALFRLAKWQNGAKWGIPGYSDFQISRFPDSGFPDILTYGNHPEFPDYWISFLFGYRDFYPSVLLVTPLRGSHPTTQ